MRVRLDRYEIANRSTQTRSLLAFVFGGLGLVFFGFIAFLGLLMIAMPDREGGGVWAARSGILLAFFLGLVPLGISALVIAWGVKQRGRFRRLGELAAIARQSPTLTTPQISHALRLSPAEAERLLIEASTLGLIEPEPPAGPPSPYAATVGSAGLPPHASGHLPASAAPISSGTVLGGAYRIEEPLGQGGMGAVHAARHLRTGRRYAVKTMLAGANASEDAIRRFEREATAASAIGHPGIVQVHDFNAAPGGLFYLVMDLLEGETLEQRLARASALPWAEAQRIGIELCAALGAATSMASSIATSSRATSSWRAPRVATPQSGSSSSTSGS